MIRHASSHGLAVLVCTVTSALLIDVCRRLVPRMYTYLEDPITGFIGNMGLSIEPQTAVTLIAAAGLGLIWGVGFYIMTHR